MKPEYDPISGEQTTGHEWDGIKELNTPVPKAFRIWLWLSIAVCVPLWMLYPNWPYVYDYTRGLLGYSSRAVVQQELAVGEALRNQEFEPYTNLGVDELAADPSLRATFEHSGSVLFADNCAACHGRDGTGQMGFPNIIDDQWLWSGTPEEIEQTIKFGINAAHDETRYAEMPAFGRDELLDHDQIQDVTEYVLEISGQAFDAEMAARGLVVFDENCSACHAEQGIGGYENGAPNLTDKAWIYGGSKESITETIENGRAGVMPAWSSRLTEDEIKKLTLYLIWAGQDHADR